MKHRICRIILCIIVIIIICGLVNIRVNNLEQIEEKCKAAPTKDAVVALCYHYIREETLWSKLLEELTNSNEIKKYIVYKDEFKWQIDTLISEGAYFATLEEVKKFRETGDYPEKCVWICFDDGDESIYKEAFPYLKEKRIPFTIFIIAGQVGNQDFNNLKLCTWEQLREMKNSGLVSFGAHTYDMHYLEDNKAIFLYKDMYNPFYRDIKKSKKVIEDNLGIEVTTMAYPFGNTNSKVSQLVQKAGFQEAFILAPYAIDSSNDPYSQNRYLVDRKNFYEIFSNWKQ